MAHDNISDQLNHLVRINQDAEAGLRTAAATVQNSELETMFSGYAKQHAKLAAELQAEMKHPGGNVSGSGTMGGALHRGWMELKSTLSGASAQSLLASCESGEESAEIAYTDAMDIITTGRTYTLLEKQRQQVQGFRARLARLVGEIKNGLEFPKNE